MRVSLRIVCTALLVAVSLLSGAPSNPTPALANETDQGTVSMEWLGHMFFRFVSPSGTVVVTTPNFDYGPAPIRLAELGHVDLVLIPNGHGDDRGDVLAVAAANENATVLSPGMLGAWLVEQGLNSSQLVTTQPGNTHTISGVRVRTVVNVHSENISGTDPVVFGGTAGYIITFENGWTVYYAASSDIHMDMQLYGSIFKPHAALLNCSGRDPELVAHMARLVSTDNPNLNTVVCTHIRFGDRAAERVGEEIRKLGLSVRVLEPAPGEVFNY